MKTSTNKHNFPVFLIICAAKITILSKINRAVNLKMGWTTTSTLARTQLSICQFSRQRSSVVVSRGLQGHTKKASTCRRDSVVPNSSLGDMFSKGIKDLFNQAEGNKSSVKTATKEFFLSDNAPSWNELETLVKERAIEFGDPSFTQDDYLEVGPPNPLSLKRTFGKDEEIRIKLYRDHAAWCPYCQKVWMQLEEKQIPYVIEKINMRCYGDKPESFYNITSSGLLPVMEFEGKIYTESAYIAALLEKEYPEQPLLPPKDSREYEKCTELMRLERRLFSAWCQWLCQSWAPSQQKANFEKVIDEVETELSKTDGAYFLGPEFSLIDIIFAPFLERMDASLAYYKGYEMRKSHPKLEKWFEAMETRPTYIASRTDYYTHAHALPPQLGGCHMTDEGVSYAKRIDGLSNGAWKLPLEPLSSTSFEPYSPGENPPQDTYLAAKQLIMNHEAVVKFALRGCGDEGSRPVMASLADPTATPGMNSFQGTDASLRHIAHALLTGIDPKQDEESLYKVAVSEEEGSGLVSGQGVIPSLVYIRDRVGVPRDLRLPSARQLRGHLNWLIDILLQRI